MEFVCNILIKISNQFGYSFNTTLNICQGLNNTIITTKYNGDNTKW